MTLTLWGQKDPLGSRDVTRHDTAKHIYKRIRGARCQRLGRVFTVNNVKHFRLQRTDRTTIDGPLTPTCRPYLAWFPRY